MATYIPMMARAIAHKRAAGEKGFLGIFSWVHLNIPSHGAELTWHGLDWVDDLECLTEPSIIYDFELPSVRPADKPWFWFPKHCTDLGLVFRLVAQENNNWKPGLVTRNGNNWMWNEHIYS